MPAALACMLHRACVMSHVQGQLFMFACAVVQYQCIPRDTLCMGGEEFLLFVSHTGIGTGTRAAAAGGVC